MVKKNIFYIKGLTIIELVIAMFIISIVVLSMMKAFAKTISMVHSAAHSSMALALAQEGLERARYEKDHAIRNDAVSGWNNFYGNFVIIEQTSETSVTTNPDGTLFDSNPCDGDKKFRFINQEGDKEPSLYYRPISTERNIGKFVVFSDEEDREQIVFQTGTGDNKEPITFYRQLFCRQVGEKYNRDPKDVLEIFVQVDWEYKGTEFALPLKTEFANLER